MGVVPSDAVPSEPAIWPLPFDLDDRFEEVLLPPAGQAVYSWSNADDKPGLAAIVAGRNTLTFMEIDCVVPFVIE